MTLADALKEISDMAKKLPQGEARHVLSNVVVGDQAWTTQASADRLFRMLVIDEGENVADSIAIYNAMIVVARICRI